MSPSCDRYAYIAWGGRCALFAALITLTSCGGAQPVVTAGDQVASAARSLSSEHSYRMQIVGKPLTDIRATATYSYVAPNSLTITEGVPGQETRIVVAAGATYASLPRGLLVAVGATDPSTLARLEGHWIGPLDGAALVALLTLVKGGGEIGPCLLQIHGTLTSEAESTWEGQQVRVVNDAGDMPGTAPGKILISVSTDLPVPRTTTGALRPGGTTSVCAGVLGLESSGHSSLFFTKDTTVVFDAFNRVAAINPPPGAIRVP